MLRDEAIRLVTAELDLATQMQPPFHSEHEGYAVILEELDELWEEVRTRQGLRSKQAIRTEAVQVAAMAVRFLVDLCLAGVPDA